MEGIPEEDENGNPIMIGDDGTVYALNDAGELEEMGDVYQLQDAYSLNDSASNLQSVSMLPLQDGGPYSLAAY